MYCVIQEDTTNFLAMLIGVYYPIIATIAVGLSVKIQYNCCWSFSKDVTVFSVSYNMYFIKQIFVSTVGF